MERGYKNNNVEKIVNLNEKLKLGEGLKGCTSAYWVIYTDTIDLSDFTSEKIFKKIGDSLVLNLGGTKSIERDELSDMLENGKRLLLFVYILLLIPMKVFRIVFIR